jgi:small subunit ribosomal protein S17
MAESVIMDSEATEARGRRKFREGVVVSDKMDKTVVVATTKRVRHPEYGKFIVQTKKFVAHDEENSCGAGDLVRIVESRPLSKTKRWKVQSILEKAVQI